MLVSLSPSRRPAKGSGTSYLPCCQPGRLYHESWSFTHLATDETFHDFCNWDLTVTPTIKASASIPLVPVSLPLTVASLAIYSLTITLLCRKFGLTRAWMVSQVKLHEHTFSWALLGWGLEIFLISRKYLPSVRDWSCVREYEICIHYSSHQGTAPF